MYLISRRKPPVIDMSEEVIYEIEILQRECRCQRKAIGFPR